MCIDLNLGHASTAGPRAQNEDFHGAILPKGLHQHWGGLVCVADGIGGCSDPRRASESLVRSLLNDYYATPEGWSSLVALGRVTASINAWMFRDGQKLERGLGTTLVAALFRGRRLTLLWAGDSRAYRLRGGRLEQLSRDHLFSTPDASWLTKAVGIDHAFMPDVREELLQQGDRFLLITDGVWNVVPDTELCRLACAEADSQRLADSLIKEAEARKTWDNATAFVVDVVGLPAEGVGDIQRAWQGIPAIFPPKLGAELDGFRVVRKVHVGHQGVLLDAIDTSSGANVILKFPDPLAMTEPQFLERFAREEWTGLRVRHPNIVPFIAQPPGRRSAVYLVMDTLLGETLRNVWQVAKQDTSPELVARWLQQAAKALLALHRKGIIHRDIKPENLMLTQSGTVVLLDFGNVRVMGLESLVEGEGGAQVVGGTPGYMAPELYMGAQGNERSDIFALGVTGYWLLTGTLPFGQPEANVVPRFAPPVPVAHLRPEVPSALAALIEKCLAVDPEARFGDMGEFLFYLGSPETLIEKKQVSLVARNPLRFYQMGFWLLFASNFLLLLLFLV